MKTCPITVAVLLTAHNRKAKTLSCLTRLFDQELGPNIKIDVFLTDDGSTDGTSESVSSLFPQVNIIKGDGQLFWNRGMFQAWESASKTADYDAYLWLNDDTMLYHDAVQLMVESAKISKFNSIICGATAAESTGEVSYSGGLMKDSVKIVPNGTLLPCDLINGNCVLIPRRIFLEIGNLDWIFRHAIGDFDYGLRARQAGFQNYVAPRFIGTCEPNPTLPRWCLTSTPLLRRFKLLYSPLGYAEPIPYFIYEKRHFGLGVALTHFLTINLRALIPSLWK